MRRAVAIVGAILVVGLFVVAAILFAKKDKSPGLASKTLPDGSVVTIEDITYGTTHEFVRGSKLLANIRQRLPPKFHKWLGSQYVSRHTSPETNLVVWYSVFDAAKQQYV